MAPRRHRLPSEAQYVRRPHLAPPSKKGSIIPRTIMDCAATDALLVPWHSPAIPEFHRYRLPSHHHVRPLRKFLPAEAIAKIFGTVNPLPNLAPTWNMAPTS